LRGGRGGISGLQTVEGPAALGSGVEVSPSRGAIPEAAPGAVGPDHDTAGGAGTVGDLDTARPAWEEELAQSWQEGLLVADRFRIRAFMGQGGMGKVYLAEDETLRRPIALKRIPQEIIFDADARDDLRQEANRLLDLAHENIVRVHTYYDGPTWPFFAMEYLQGPTLKKLLRQRKREGRTFSVEEVLVVARQVGNGLLHAHARNIVHRDLKPANLMLAQPPGSELTEGDLIKITDFGISRVLADSTLRQTGKRSGTLPYMSPEQFRGEPSTVQSDIYSLACTLYELLTGKPPFHSGDIGYQILSVSPRAPVGVPRSMAGAILRGLSKEPLSRFDSVSDFLEALEGRKVARRRERPFWRKGLFSLGARAAAAAAGVAVFLLVLVLASSYAFQDRSPEQNPLASRNPAASPRALLPEARGSRAQSPEAEALASFREAVAAAIDAQLAGVIGKPPGAPGEMAATTSFTLVFSESDPGFQPSLLEKLALEYFRLDTPADLHRVAGVAEGGKRLFRLLALREGSYRLRAFLRRDESPGISFQTLHERAFQVDLTAPEFLVRPVHPRAFVDPVNLCTFDEEVELALVSAVDPRGPSDIKEAYFQLVAGSMAMGRRRIEDPQSWKVQLSPGVDNVFRLHALDAAGNRSRDVEVSLRRYRLEWKLIEVLSVTGNVAHIQGTLRFEGGVSPRLRFLVNERLTDFVWPDAAPALAFVTAVIESLAAPALAPLDKFAGPASAPLPAGAMDQVAFKASLPLDRAINTLEMRYSWNDGPPKPFAQVCSLSRVKAAAPHVVLDPYERRTRLPRLALGGRVDPFFDGLRMRLENQGKTLTEVELAPDGSGGARFLEELSLSTRPGEEHNRIAIKFSYADAPLLEPAAPVIEVYYDNLRPRYDPLRFERDGGDLLVWIQPNEELSSLQVRAVAGEGDTGMYQQLLPEPTSPSSLPIYCWRLPQADRARELVLELTDLAGNTFLKEEYYSPLALESAVAELASSAPRSGGWPEAQRWTPGEGRGRGEPQPGTVIIRSAFLEEMGLSFVTFGADRFEMGETEVTEKVWNRFLRDRGRAGAASYGGRKDHPMVIADQPVNLLKEFAVWFQEQAADGYQYFVPSASQWLCAFAGTRDAREATDRIRAWFDASFIAKPGERYGFVIASKVRSRPENATPSGLFDMESNVQELVFKDGEELFAVIGGHNQLVYREDILKHCLSIRPFNEGQQIMLGKVTGFRLCRRPATGR
jgi:serine/threonine protein kinase